MKFSYKIVSTKGLGEFIQMREKDPDFIKGIETVPTLKALYEGWFRANTELFQIVQDHAEINTEEDVLNFYGAAGYRLVSMQGTTFYFIKED